MHKQRTRGIDIHADTHTNTNRGLLEWRSTAEEAHSHTQNVSEDRDAQPTYSRPPIHTHRNVDVGEHAVVKDHYLGLVRCWVRERGDEVEVRCRGVEANGG